VAESHKIQKDSVVSSSTPSRRQGKVLDKSEPGEPLAYLHGHGSIVRGLENALEARPPARAST